MARNGKLLTDKQLRAKKSLVDLNTQCRSLIIPRVDNKGFPYITFSFKYFAQQDLFGVGEQDSGWFVSLFDRISDLSGKTKAILDNPVERDAYRLHTIDWKAKKCPITIDDLVSVPQNIKDGAEDDFFWQFQLSKTTGRVIGFFNEDFTVFYLVLLDPKHNLQPSKYYGYSVDETKMAVTEYDRIQMWIADASKKQTEACRGNTKCPLYKVNTEYVRSDAFYACVDPDLKDRYVDLVESGEFQSKFEEFLFTEYCKDDI